MKASTIKCALVATIALGAGVSLAQEMGATPTKPSEDQGVQMAIEAQGDENQAVSCGLRESASPRDALAQLHQELGEKYYEGFHPDRGAYIQCAFATKPCTEDVFKDDEFMTMRDALVSEAILGAKANIILALRAEYAAQQGQVAMKLPKFEKQYREQIAAKENQKRKVVRQFVAMDGGLEKTFAAATDDLLWRHAVEAVLARFQSREDIQDLKGDVEEAKRQILELESEARSYAKMPIDNFHSQIDAAAHETLLGATVLKQAESFDGKLYQIAVAVIWSDTLRERAEKTLAGKLYKSEKNGDMSLTAWLNSCRENNTLGAIVGARQYTDDNGRHYFLGIASADVNSDLDNIQLNMEQTDFFARQQALFSLCSDVFTTNAASATLKSFGGQKHIPMSAYAKEAGQEFKKQQVSGLTKVYSATVTHKITGRKIYVSVAAVDGVLAARSSKILRDMYASASKAALRANFIRGERVGQLQVYNWARTDEASFQQGLEAGANGVLSIVAPKSAVTGPKGLGTTGRKPATQNNGNGSSCVPTPQIVPDGQKINDDF